MLYHRTDAAENILTHGFTTVPNHYGVGDEHEGVFLGDVPLDGNEGAKGRQLLAVEVVESVVAPFEWIDESGEATYREWCVPAEIVNAHAEVRLMTEEETDEAERVGSLLRQRRAGILD